MSANRIGMMLLLVAACLANTACTHVYKIDTAPIDGYATAAKRNLDVELRLTDEFSNYTWETKKMGDTFQMPLGEALSNNAEAMSKALFTNVVVRRTGSESQAGSSGADAVLTPKLITVERAMGTWAFGKMKTVIEVEWSLANRSGGLVWLQTIQGEGEANTGNLFTHHDNAKEQARLALEQLFTRTFDAMAAAPEIGALAR